MTKIKIDKLVSMKAGNSNDGFYVEILGIDGTCYVEWNDTDGFKVNLIDVQIPDLNDRDKIIEKIKLYNKNN